jgi:hypothetical protein
MECFALERHLDLGKQGFYDYRVTGFKVDGDVPSFAGFLCRTKVGRH